MSDKNRYNQLLGEMKFLNSYNKDYDFSITDYLKAGYTLKGIDEYLEKKQITYNHTVSTIINKYGIDVDDLYKDLNEIWNAIPSDSFSDRALDKVGVNNKSIKKGISFVAKLLVGWTLVAADSYPAEQKWDLYKKNVYDLVSRYADKIR